MMSDYFALLNQARRPWLDPSALREEFVARSAAFHPDRVHDRGEAARQEAQDRCTALNTAYQCLREPKDRLRHLLSLERGAPPEELQRVEPELLELFSAVNETCRRADSLLAEKEKLSSPLLQVKWLEQAHDHRERLQGVAQELAGRLERLDQELRQADEDWEKAAPGNRDLVLTRLEAMYRLFGFLNRWNAQVQERLLQLSL